jgi:hypothetical protein
MSEFLETLKQRQADSQRRLAIMTANLQKAQAEHQQAAQEAASWTNAVNAETRREQSTAAQSGDQLQSPPKQEPPKVVIATTGPAVLLEDAEPVSDVNKSRLIREVLQQNPNGLRPVTVWLRLQNQVPRAYVYSVLSRMKQKKQVREIRGKYFLVQSAPKPIDGKPVGVAGVN